MAIRLPGSTRTDGAGGAGTDGSLTKTFGPRGTLHLLPTRDLALWVGALGNVPRGSQPVPRRCPAHRRADGRRGGGGRRGAARGRAHGRRARRRGGRAHRLLGRRPGDAGVPGVLAPLAAGGRPAAPTAACWSSGPTADARSPTPARAAGDPAFAPAPPEVAEPWFVARLPPRLRARDPRAPGPVERRSPALGARAARRGSHAGGRRRPRQSPWSTRATPRRSRSAGACGCCPTSTRSAWASRRGRRCSPAAPGSARWPAPRPATTRCSWSTAWCRASGTSAGRDAGSRSPSRPGPISARPGCAALDAQVARLGEILEGEPRLTLGEVTVGPHA